MGMAWERCYNLTPLQAVRMASRTNTRTSSAIALSLSDRNSRSCGEKQGEGGRREEEGEGGSREGEGAVKYWRWEWPGNEAII